MNKSYLKEKRLKLGLTMLDLSKKVGVSEATISRWESGDIDNMKRDKIALLAKALEISPLQILGIDETDQNSTSSSSKMPTLTAKDERSIQKRLEAVLNDLMPGNNALAYYDGEEPMTDEDKELLRISLENTMKLAKQMAKQKFTPKKYRK
ncbi:transcriptional regulator with XRE-family HTH domain [Sporomusaceae bacterium BoRhaA]|uniref:helix-turn-helix domain-containing protein n=1 Tax=Pelorhabdus rhamnosifermentans TaxID=2772457 RepID=UPI001C05F02F|nr:helix-turn-helix transcriptional regulator [Pelorhabdus rhamnosifermentans]MBU2703598.1 transcriptional regulator with XRE-family HTH domain [Pelorhabdus rhamnosifermentans]